jgi:hypothetical protein
MLLFHKNSVRGRNNLLQFICKYVTLSLFSCTVLLHNIHTHTNSNTEYTSSHSYRRRQCTLNHDIYIRYMPSAAPPGKKFYKITVDLTDLKHEIQFLYSRNILIVRITTSDLHLTPLRSLYAASVIQLPKTRHNNSKIHLPSSFSDPNYAVYHQQLTYTQKKI